MRVPLKSFALALPLLCLSVGAQAQRTPKVAVVVAGDPEDELLALANTLNEAIDAAPELRLPADRATLAAMAGAPAPAEDDGLGRIRSLRRRLAWEGPNDPEILHTLGRGGGTSALVVLRAADGAVSLEVFDVGARQYYDELTRVDMANPEASLPFIVSRAQAAWRRARSAPSDPEATAPAQAAARDDAHAAAPANADAAVGAEPSPAPAAHPARVWMRKNWAYFVAGALLVGAAVAIGLSARNNSASSELSLRFRPGGS